MAKKKRIQRAPYGEVVDSREVGGIEMGVFQDGTVFLGARGLAAMCGVVPSTIIEWAQNHDPGSGRQRDAKIAELIREQGYAYVAIYYPVAYKGTVAYAFPEAVCIAVLRYYAAIGWKTASTNLGKLAGRTLRDVVYDALRYEDDAHNYQRFRAFHDRLSLNKMPIGYFSVFSESASMVLHAIQGGLVVDRHTVPDISVGRRWSDYWIANGLAKTYGERKRYLHVYPDYFPQSRANVEPWIYPNLALGVFRVWLETEYIPKFYPQYLNGQVGKKAIAATSVVRLLEAMKPAGDPHAG